MPSVRFAGAPTVHYVGEGSAWLEHQVVLSEPSAQVVTVTITGPGYRQGDMDVSTQTVTFQPGQTTATFRVAIYEDSQDEPDEVFGYTIASATNASVDMATEMGVEVRTLLGYIVDNDVPIGPTVRFAGAPSVHYVQEGAGWLEHQLVLSQPSSQPVTVTITGPGYRQGDMDVSTQTVTFQPGQTTATFRVAIYEDSQDEPDEVFGYTIASATNASVDMATEMGVEVRTLLGYIVDNDPAGGSASPGQTLTATTSGAILTGGSGDDTITGLSGANVLRGGEGDDLIRGGVDFDDTHGNLGNDTVYGGAGADWVVGGQGADLLYGDIGGDVVLGNLGDDTCLGGDGIDWVRGGQANDVVEGGGGDDWLSGDRGNDTLTGGAGADIFNYFSGAGQDQVLDFDGVSGDRIRFEGNAVSYIVTSVGGDTRIAFGGGDEIILKGVTNFDTSWIVLAPV